MSDAGAAGDAGERGAVARAWAEGALAGAAGALAAVLPAALRTSERGPSLPAAWIALAGASAIVLVPLTGALRVARPWPPAALAVPLGLLIALGPLGRLAQFLVTRTHHRPLGAATFAVVAVAVSLAAMAFAARMLGTARRGSSPLSRRLAAAALALAALVSAALATGPLLALVGTPGLRAGTLDALLGLGAASIGAWMRLPAAASHARKLGPVASALLVAAGVTVLRSSPELVTAAREAAPIALGLGVALAR